MNKGKKKKIEKFIDCGTCYLAIIGKGKDREAFLCGCGAYIDYSNKGPDPNDLEHDITAGLDATVLDQQSTLFRMDKKTLKKIMKEMEY